MKRPGAAALLCFLYAVTLTGPLPGAAAQEVPPPELEDPGPQKTRHTGTPFLDNAEITGGIYFFWRDRLRYEPTTGDYATNLNHASLQANADFVSGYLGNVLGFDVGIFGSHDLFNHGAVDHEMGFEPWHDPWHPDWDNTSTLDAFSVYKAAVKLKAGPVWAQAGYFQPSGPGVLGVNWSILPGTWRGINAGADFGRLSLAAAWADAYKPPWLLEVHRFRKNDGETLVPWLWSLGGRYAFDNGVTLELAYGESKNHLRNGHLKISRHTEVNSARLTVGYHLYAMQDSDDSGRNDNDNFDGLAVQHYFFARYEPGLWAFRLEGTWTFAPMSSPYSQGQFAYRLTDRNGSTAGAYDVWWDARSDWNADNEKAAYVGVQRRLDDLLPVTGVYLGVGAAGGCDGKGYATKERLTEWAFTFDAGYVKPDGPLEGAFVRLHYTEYRNGTDAPSWGVYKNAFQSEHDVKLWIGIPFSL